MDTVVVIAALLLLVGMAYRGASVILAAPLAALLAVAYTDPAQIGPAFSGIYLKALGGFVETYFAVFLLGAAFGKLMELSGYAGSVASTLVTVVGREAAILATVIVAAVMTYGGVSLFVVVFTVYPICASLFRHAGIPKRLLPAAIALGAFTFSMDSVPGSPQIQNIIPAAYFGTTTWAAPWLGSIGALFIAIAGVTYLEWRRRSSRAEGYGAEHINEPEAVDSARLPPVWLAFAPLLIVLLANLYLTGFIPARFGATVYANLPGSKAPVALTTQAVAALWAAEAALVSGCVFVGLTRLAALKLRIGEGLKSAVAGAMLAAINTASEFGFGAVIAVLPGFALVRAGVSMIGNPLVNEAVTITTLAGMTGSGSGGLSLALGAMGNQFLARGLSAGIPPEVMHRVAAMACGGMDTLPHNGAVITLLAVTGLTHRQAYADIFAITAIKTVAVFVVIGVHYLTGLS